MQSVLRTTDLDLFLGVSRRILYHLSYQGRPKFSCKNKKKLRLYSRKWVHSCPPVFLQLDCEASVSTNSISHNQVIAHYIL